MLKSLTNFATECNQKNISDLSNIKATIQNEVEEKENLL